MSKISITLLLIMTTVVLGFSQLANDDCANATEIPSVTGFCSLEAAFTNVGATDSDVPLPDCFANTNDQDRDVWFTFIAVANTVNIAVRGNTEFNEGGTLERPEFVLYSGSCGDLIEEQCSNDGFSSNAVSSITEPLEIGQRYYIRVNGENRRTGTFQLCINNFNEVPAPVSDCSDATLLCNKSTISIPYVNGRGRAEDLEGQACADISENGCGIDEFNSVWYKWICETPGNLSINIVPNNDEDDFDFMVFKLPSGINNCNNKETLRCMFSGANVGRPFSEWEPCTGATGLRGVGGDLSEFCGCAEEDDNFVDELEMETGDAYAIVIMNFSDSGAGFTLEFGGSGTFQGPSADFAIDASILIDEEDNSICIGEQIEIFDSSTTSIGRITEWNWAFGVNASPSRTTGQGPHRVTYSETGSKFVALTVGLDIGCFVTTVEEIEVLETPTINYTTTLPECNGGMDGSISLEVTGGTPDYVFDWQDGQGFNPDRILISELPKGDYTVRVRDSENCYSEITIPLPEDTILLNRNLAPATDPSCFGFEDGFLTIVPERGLPPYQYNFGNGYIDNNILEGVGIGEYKVRVRDTQGCVSEFLIPVGQPDSLELSVSSQDASCANTVDGTVLAEPNGGVGGFSFLWDDNQTSSTASIEGLPADTYTVTVQDANGCEIVGTAIINQPDSIVAAILDVQNALCAGEASGLILVGASGGNPPFQYSTDGTSFQDTPELTQLAEGNYQIIIRDANNCQTSIEASINEPDPIFIDAGEEQVVVLGTTVDLMALVTPPDAEGTVIWQAGDSTIIATSADASVLPLGETTFTATFLNDSNCQVSDEVLIRVSKAPVYVPNIFSPNTDGSNERFTIYSNQAIENIALLRIFNRWGELLYEAENFPANDETYGWDGTYQGELLNPGVFAFYAEVNYIDGRNEVLEGDITLVR